MSLKPLVVGRVIRVISDPNRAEPYKEGENRVFPVSVFYPACQSSTEIGDTNLLSLFTPAVDEAKAVFLDMGIEKEALESIDISVQDNAIPESDGSLPVVILSPGFGIDRDLYIETITAVVQSGYVVVSVGAPYDSFLTVYPDGKVVLQADRHPNDLQQIQTRRQDIQLVFEHLERWNEEDFFHEMFDLNRIGLIGHSLGGAAVFEVASENRDVGCVILFDASLHLIGDRTPNIPVLNIWQEASWEDDDEIATAYTEKQRWLYDHLPSSRSFVKIVGATHLSFATVGRLIGTASPSVTMAIQQLTLAFLNEFLQGDDGAYMKFMRGVERPANVVTIDGVGHPSKTRAFNRTQGV